MVKIDISEEEAELLMAALIKASTLSDASTQARLSPILGQLVVKIATANLPPFQKSSTESAPPPRTTSDCDMEVGPCSCGAWHGSGKIKAREYEFKGGYPISNGILRVEGPNELYRVYVRSQDSTEYAGEYSLEKQARLAWLQGSRQLGQHVTADDAKLYEWVDGRYVAVYKRVSIKEDK